MDIAGRCHNILRFSFIMSVMFRSVCSAYSPRCKTRDAVAMRPYDYSFFFLPPPPLATLISLSRNLSRTSNVSRKNLHLANSDLGRRSRPSEDINLVINLCSFTSAKRSQHRKTSNLNYPLFPNDSHSIYSGT